MTFHTDHARFSVVEYFLGSDPTTCTPVGEWWQKIVIRVVVFREEQDERDEGVTST